MGCSVLLFEFRSDVIAPAMKQGGNGSNPFVAYNNNCKDNEKQGLNRS